MGFPLTANGAIYLLNAYCDRSPISSYECLVLQKYMRTSHSDGGTHTYYYAKVQSWRLDKVTEKIAIGKSEYNSIIERRTIMIIDSLPGALGYERIIRRELRN